MNKPRTESEMLELWRLIRAAEPLRLDCTVTRTDGIDSDAIFRAEMRAWYLRLLDGAPPEMLQPVDMAAAAEVSSPGSLTLIKAPAGVRRVLSLRFSDMAAPIVPDAAPRLVRSRAANPFCRRPLAARIGPTLIIAAGVSGTLAELSCAYDFGPDNYLFSDRALETIPTDSQP